MAIYYKCDDLSPTNLVCNHVKEALQVIKVDGDYFRAGLSIQMAKNLINYLLNELGGWVEKLPDDYQMNDPDNLGFGYYEGDPSYAIIRFNE